MSEERKITSFDSVRNKAITKELDNCFYRGSITIKISGSSPQDVQYEIYTEFFTKEEMIKYLTDAYMILISKKEVKETILNYDLILNTCTTIYFYHPLDKDINKLLYFQYSSEVSDEQIEHIIAATILTTTD